MVESFPLCSFPLLPPLYLLLAVLTFLGFMDTSQAEELLYVLGVNASSLFPVSLSFSEFSAEPPRDLSFCFCCWMIWVAAVQSGHEILLHPVVGLHDP